MAFVPLVRQFQSFYELQDSLGDCKMKLEKDTPMILGDETVPLDKTVEIIQSLTAKIWELPRQEVNTALSVIEKLEHNYKDLKESSFLTKCLCCISPWEPKIDVNTPLDKAKRRLLVVKRVYEYIALNRIHDRQRLQGSTSIYIRPAESQLERAFNINSEGRVFVHLNRKKKGDASLDEGAEKVVTFAYEMGTPNIFVSAGYKNVNPTEFKFLQAFRNIPGFVQLVDYFKYNKKGKEKYRALFEYCSGGDLYDACTENRLNRRDRKKIFIELIENVALMHKRGYLHRDLKMENILLKPEANGFKPIIADLGSMCEQSDFLERMVLHPYTYSYLSPEYASALSSSHKRGQKLLDANTDCLDSWALAIVLNFMVGTTLPPWMGRKGKKASLNEIKRGWMPEPRAKNSPQHLVWEMIEKRLVATEAEKRLPTLDWTKY